MSVQSDLARVKGLKLTKQQQLALRVHNSNLRNQRKELEYKMKLITKAARKKAGIPAKKKKLTEAEHAKVKEQLTVQQRRFIARAMDDWAEISRQLFRFGGERTTPEFHPY